MSSFQAHARCPTFTTHNNADPTAALFLTTRCSEKPIYQKRREEKMRTKYLEGLALFTFP
ncbi:unnamed protein product [Tuber melanosporum]|uniref:(Perigord truffle) hypothetical protein n=1 Tax=Tuber melanosporum (strain Mel28) TaxID=656061 RepID=D5G8J1_TUBMM|nr:uncharacterized protein GSTUM_00002897001 [Tuber melanosporum]CAZ80838.1 unnamed protein product [Tuber melanosporum]